MPEKPKVTYAKPPEQVIGKAAREHMNATPEQMAALADAEGVEAERLFLELMTEHHIGGVEMAEAVLARTELPLVTNLARGMVTLQSKEIDYMRELLEARQ